MLSELYKARAKNQTQENWISLKFCINLQRRD